MGLPSHCRDAAGSLLPGGGIARPCDPAWAGQACPEPSRAVQQMALLFSL